MKSTPCGAARGFGIRLALLPVVFCWLSGCTSPAAAAGPADRVTSKAFRRAAQRIMASVVKIETFGGLSGRVGGARQEGISKPGEGPTTGVVISPDGYIITSTFNFIRKPPLITVVLADGSRHIAELLGRDETRKICLLKIDKAPPLAVPEMVAHEQLRVGQWAISLGLGYGDKEPAISAGIISANRRISARAVQTDANISPANYGGPLVDIEGRLIGICVPLSPMSGKEAAGSEWYDSGIGFAVPLHGAESLIARLKNKETIAPGRLGIRVAALSPDGAGAKIAAVQPDSPAAKAGLEKEDALLALEGEAILDTVHFSTVLGRYVAGDKIKIKVRRAENEVVAEAELAAGEDLPTSGKQAPQPGSEQP